MNNFYVYWIHLSTHTDVNTEGYVGITSKTPADRFKRHINNAFKGGEFIIHNAIRKYGVDELYVTTICLTSPEHARWLEKKLRPEPFIGWNMQRGGIGNPYIPEDTRKRGALKASKTRKERGFDMSGEKHPNWKGGVSEYYLRKHGLYVKKTIEELKAIGVDKMERFVAENGYYPAQDPSTRKKISESHKKRFEDNGPWVNSQANKDLWLQAGYIYILRKTVALSRTLISSIIKLPAASVSNVTDRFHKGWNPLDDHKWINFYEQNKTTGHPPIEELILQIQNAQCQFSRT